MQDDQEIKIFTCPFNAYHKLYDNRKHQFHIARCKDRRGKSLYHCKFYHMHIYTTVQELLQHELTCERKPIKKEEENPVSELSLLDNKVRCPSATFCKYNYEHSYKTLEDREHHEKTCPNKVEMEFKLSQSESIYNRHKHSIKEKQQNK